jgi:hypothetical protein
LSLSAPLLHQARQALIRHGLVAYRRPLYQVLALGAPEPAPADAPRRKTTRSTSRLCSTRLGRCCHDG